MTRYDEIELVNVRVAVMVTVLVALMMVTAIIIDSAILLSISFVLFLIGLILSPVIAMICDMWLTKEEA